MIALVLHHVVEPLIAHGEDFQLLPVLAEKWEAGTDFKNFTFHLRKGRLFHNGREMVADDVKYSLERFMKVNPRRDLLKNVERIEAVDKYTVRLHEGAGCVRPFRFGRSFARHGHRAQGGSGKTGRNLQTPRRDRSLQVCGMEAGPLRHAGALRRL